MRRPLVALALLLAACAGSAKREAASLSEAVDQYRRADGASRASRQAAVSSVACTVSQVCAAKDACVAAMVPTTRALALKDEVTARVADLEKGTLTRDSPEASALPGELDEAGRLLAEGRDKMRTCDAALTALKADL